MQQPALQALSNYIIHIVFRSNSKVLTLSIIFLPHYVDVAGLYYVVHEKLASIAVGTELIA